MSLNQRLAESQEYSHGRFGLLKSHSLRVLALASALSAHADGSSGARATPVAVFDVIQVDTAQAKVKGLLRIRNPTPDTLLLFPLEVSVPLGQIDITLDRGDSSEVYRIWGARDVACYDPDTLLPGGEIKQHLTLGHGRWRTENPDPAQGRSVSRILNPLRGGGERGGVRAIGLKYQLGFPIEDLKKVDFDGFNISVRDCPYRYYREPIVAPPVVVNLPG
jgi:hypothetical protein